MGYVHGRLIGRDVGTYTIDSDDLINRFTDASLDVRIERVDVTVVKDGPRRSRAAHYSWRTRCGAAIENTALQLTKGRAHYLSDLDWLMTTGSSPPTIGHEFSGIVGPEGFSMPFGDQAQNEGAEWVGTSDLYMDGIPLLIYPDSAVGDVYNPVAAGS